MSDKSLPLFLLTALTAAGTGAQTGGAPEQRIAVTVDGVPKTLQVAPVSIDLYELERR